MSSIEAVAQSWMVDPPWQKVFKHTFNVLEDYIAYILISVGAAALSIRLLTTLATGEVACMLIGVANGTETGNLLPYATGGGLAMINFAQTHQSCISNVYSEFMQYLPYLMLMQTLVLVIVEKFAFKFPRIAQKVERFYKNIVEESLFGKDPDVTEDMTDPKKSTEAISRRRQRNEICMLMKRSSFIHDMYIGKHIFKCILVCFYITTNVSNISSSMEMPTRCFIPVHDFPNVVDDDGTVMFQCKAKKLSFTVFCLWVQNGLFVLYLIFSLGCLVWTWQFRPVTNLIRTINKVRKSWDTPVPVKAHDGKDFLFLFDLLAHSCGLESTLRVLTHSDINFFQICKPKFNVQKHLLFSEDKLKISWQPADIERWLHTKSKKHQSRFRVIEIDSYEVTIFPAESVINTQTIPVASADDVGMDGDECTYYTWFYDLAGGKTEYVVTIACMIGKSRMKGEKIVTNLVPYGAERPSTGMLKSADTNQVEIFWDPPKGEFTKYILCIERIFDRPTASIASLLRSKASNLNIHDAHGEITDRQHVRQVENLNPKFTEYTIHGLEPGERYKIELGTVTGNVATNHPIFDVVMTKPQPVSGLMAGGVSSSSCTLHWLVPEGHPCLKGFQLQVIGHDGKLFDQGSIPKSQKSFVVHGLTGGYDYDIALKSMCYFEGISTESVPATTSIATVPEAVKHLRLENATSNSLFIRWDTSTPIGVQSYRHRLTCECAALGYSNSVELSGDKQQYNFARLPEPEGAGQAYQVSIVLSVVTPRGNEVESTAAVETFATLPYKPSALRYAATEDDEPMLAWTRSPTPNVTAYRVRWRPAAEEGAKVTEVFVQQVDEKEELSFILSGLTPDVVYKISVQAVVELADGLKVESKETPERMMWKDGTRLVHVEEYGRQQSMRNPNEYN